MLVDPTPEIEAIAESIPDAPGPEDIEANLRFRERIIALGNKSVDFAKAVNLKCSRDPVFWFNTFVWTQNPKDFPKDPHRPVVLFPNQAEYVLYLHDHVERGEPFVLEKSREQLASVATSNYALWRLFYSKNADTLIGSYRKDAVEGASYAASIFPKMDYTIDYLPDWMLPDGWIRKRPGPCRTEMVIKNPETKKVLKGDTCNEKFSRGGRFAWVWLDEFAHVERQDAIHTAVGNATNCYVYTTTPNGYELFAQLANSSTIDKFTLHWTGNYLWHPKGYSPEECQWNLKEPSKSVWPKEWICPPGCKYHPNGGWPHSERYDFECKKQDDPKKVAQELDIHYAQSGSNVFNQTHVQNAIDHLAKNPPKYRYYKLHFDTKDAQPIRPGEEDFDEQWFRQIKSFPVYAEECTGGSLKVYEEPFTCRDKSCVCGGTGLHVYVFGGDVARYVDGDFNNGYMWDATAGRCVAEWNGRLNAKPLAMEWVKLCKWYGSSSKPKWPNAYAFIESNDVGLVVNENVDKMGIYVPADRSESSIKKKKTLRLGVFIDKYKKPYIINNCLQPEIEAFDVARAEAFPDAPRLPRLVVPFVDFWKECLTYVYHYTEDTKNRPESAKMGAQTRKHHDDRVMSMGQCLYGCMRLFGRVRGVVPKSTMAKHLAWRESQGRRPTFAKS